MCSQLEGTYSPSSAAYEASLSAGKRHGWNEEKIRTSIIARFGPGQVIEAKLLRAQVGSKPTHHGSYIQALCCDLGVALRQRDTYLIDLCASMCVLG